MTFGRSFDASFGPFSLLRALGVDPRALEAELLGHQDQARELESTDTFQRMRRSMVLAEVARLLQSGAIPRGGMMPRPSASACPCPDRYAAPPPASFGEASDPAGAGGASPPAAPTLASGSLRARACRIFSQASRGGRAAVLQELLRVDPFARQQVEMMLGGRLMPGDLPAGPMFIQPFPAGRSAPGGQANAASAALYAMFAAPALPPSMGGGATPFDARMLGGLAQAAGRSGVPTFGSAEPAAATFAGGGGAGGLQAGSPGPYQGSFGLGASGGDEVTGVLNDPTLTVEDKVTLMIMLIMKKMDKDIERQAQSINALQQQQNGGGGAAGGAGGGQAMGGSPSIDVETMKLKRLIDKRSQMFDMLRQIIDKYNQAAKGIIDSIGR